jgi:hypothetical protein
MPRNPDCTLCELRRVLSYNPKTGVWRWNYGRKCGSVAGVIDRTNGYRIISIDGKHYRSSRLAWFYMTGHWPSQQVDHENRLKSDDRWKNLRQASRSQNQANKEVRRDSKTQVKGVSYHCGSYLAQIKVNGKQLYLGRFKSLGLASDAYKRASKKYFGVFAYAS